jgi:hypothetical protein
MAYAAKKGVTAESLIRTNIVPPHFADALYAWADRQKASDMTLGEQP